MMLAEEPRDRYLSQEERGRLLQAIERHAPHIGPIVTYMLAVPCRSGELASLPKTAYNSFTNTVYIPDSKAGIPINKPVPDEMRSYFLSIPADCPYLFYRHDRNGFHPIGDFKKAWKTCLRFAGLKNVRVHDLRHCAASDLYEAGNPERRIMDIAGWRTSRGKPA